VTYFLNIISFFLQRLNWVSVLDILLVTAIFFFVLMMVRDTQAAALLRGMVLLLIVLSLMTNIVELPAFTWLVRTTLPTLLLAIPVIFAPEIRRGLERLGRAGETTFYFRQSVARQKKIQDMINAVVTASMRLSERMHGALIVLCRSDSLYEYISTGVKMNSEVTPELLLQIFYPNTPLHDGAVIISNLKITAAACVMPLSASGILNRSPERQMGLRHRASLGISEVTDAISIVVSEESGLISISQNGRLIRHLDSERLRNLLEAFLIPPQLPTDPMRFLRNLVQRREIKDQPEE
jgi:diadenylate cyclase